MSTVPDLNLLPDAERVVANFLRAQPRMQALVADRIYTAFPAQAGPGPLLLVQRIGGEPPLSMPLVVDGAVLQLDAYGGPKATAYALAATARACLCQLEGQVMPEGAVGAVRFGALRWFPDDTYDQPRPRYLVEVTVTVVAAKTPVVMAAVVPAAQEA
jgi:hypothetical protein